MVRPQNEKFLSFQEDDLGIQLRDDIGVESTFPKPQQILERIAGKNAAWLYRFNE